MWSRLSRRSLGQACQVQNNVQRIPIYCARFFSTSGGKADEMRDLMREEFEGIDITEADVLEENADFFNDAFGVRANTSFLADLQTSGDTGSHWASEEDVNNPFDFPLLNFTELCHKSALNVCITEQNSDRPVDEVMASVQNILSSLSQVGGPLHKKSGDASDANKNVEGGKNGEILQDAKHTKVTQTMCNFDGVYSVFYPVVASQLESLKEVFHNKDMSTQNQQEDEDAIPSITTLQKAKDCGGRFDVYLAGKNRDTIFFTSNVTARTLETAKAEVERRYDEVVQQCRQTGRSAPVWVDEYLCVERHYVLTLAHPPIMRDLPLVQVQMNMQLEQQHGGAQEDPVVAVLEFPVMNVLTTNDTLCMLGVPDADKEYKAREIEFLLKAVLFGAVFPAPIPPSYIPTVQEDMEAQFESEGAMDRVEKIARSTIAMYGESSPLAAVLPLPGEPLVSEDQLQNDPLLAVLYGDPALYMQA